MCLAEEDPDLYRATVEDAEPLTSPLDGAARAAPPFHSSGVDANNGQTPQPEELPKVIVSSDTQFPVDVVIALIVRQQHI